MMDAELQWVADRHPRFGRANVPFKGKRSRTSAGEEVKEVAQAYKRDHVGQDQFAALWTEALRKPPKRRLAVIEAACGSANDYRFFQTYGLAALLDYTGFDLTSLNIDNARQMFPGVDFRIGDVQDIDAADRSHDWAVAHDLLEHLSPAACNRAIDELCRIAGRGVLISFFRMGNHSEHKIQAKRFYHVTSSRYRIHEQFERHCTDIRWIHVRSFLKERTGFSDYYNNTRRPGGYRTISAIPGHHSSTAPHSAAPRSPSRATSARRPWGSVALALPDMSVMHTVTARISASSWPGATSTP